MYRSGNINGAVSSNVVRTHHRSYFEDMMCTEHSYPNSIALLISLGTALVTESSVRLLLQLSQLWRTEFISQYSTLELASSPL